MPFYSKRKRPDFAGTAVGFVLLVGLSGCGPDDEPVVAKGKPLPPCPQTGRVYTESELIDVAAENLISRDMSRCSVKYSSVAEFHRRNPKCCEIDYDHINLREPITQRTLSGIGYLIGGVTLNHFCGSEDRSVGKYRIGFANITSCGVITESTAFPAD